MSLNKNKIEILLITKKGNKTELKEKKTPIKPTIKKC